MAESAASGAEQTRFARGTGEMQQATKWLMAVVAGFASLFTAGLRFSDVGRLRGTQLLLAGVGVTLVLAAAFAVLRAAARVLAAPYETLRDAVVNARAQRRGHTNRLDTDPRTDAINSEDDLVFRGRAGDYVELFRLFRTANADLREATVDATSEVDTSRLEHQVDVLAQTAERAADFLDHLATRERFTALLRWLALAAATSLCGIALLAYALGHAPPLVTRPTSVTVVLAHPYPVRFGCATTELAGIAIGGDWDRPEVVLSGPAPCRPGRVTISEKTGVVVPKP